MKRFLYFTLSLLITLPAFAQDERYSRVAEVGGLPAFAQDEPSTLGQSLPRDPAFLMRMREQLASDLRATQQALGLINPSDTQLVETLRTRQADLAKQISDVARELQTLNTPGIGGMSQGPETRPGMTPLPPALVPIQPMQTMPEPGWRQPEPGMPPGMAGGIGIMPPGAMPGAMMPMGGVQPFLPNGTPVAPMTTGGIPVDRMGVPFGYHLPMDTPPNVPQWGAPAQAWDHWGPRLPKELTEVRQSVESLRKEITELRETVKSLETQIQLLNRTILLSERVNERVNEGRTE